MNHFLNQTILRGLGAAFLVLLLPASLLAQMGNDNPTGVSGIYNGNVNTAGSYDPYTGNATRSITDISVAGAVGAYPLSFTRTMNSRYNISAGLEFGPSGSWRHSYQWSIEPHVYHSSGPNRWNYLPNVYTVNYPDGRRLSFSQASGDTKFRAGSGISDRFQQLTNANGGTVYLLLPDGGKIAFQATVDRQEISEVTHLTESYFSYELVGIIDPYGQTTTVTYGMNTMTIQEPAGRTLTAYYISTPWNGDTVIDRVVSSDGRSVKYNYGGYQPAGSTTYTCLGNVQYLDPNGTSYVQAIYAYRPGNIDPNDRPLLLWAIDPMYPGPMWAISYSFVPGDFYQFGETPVYGELQSENYLDPFTGTPGQVVSRLSRNGNTRTETRGDGPSRTFNYYGSKVVSYTDFKNQLSYISYDGNGFRNGFTDPRNNTTTTSREGLIGATSVLTHPDQSTQGYAYWYRDGAPYFVQIRGDERGHNTYFTRDPNNFQLTRIDYPDYPNGAYETFTYNNFGQVLSHRLTNGGTEYFEYDNTSGPATRGLKTKYTDPLGNVTHYYYYQTGPNMDRLQVVTDARGNSTAYEYNLRGQLTHIQHQDYTWIQYGYNVDGTLAWTYDENHPNGGNDPNQRTRYTYDIYKRVVTTTNPMGETTSFVYAQDWANAYNQTTTNVKGTFSPMGKQVHYAYDENWQRTIMRVPPGSDANDAWTFYGYDAAGNLTWTQDPRGYATTFGYDNRNRRTSATNALSQTTSWQYDAMNNLTRETRPDQSYSRTEYDSMNRIMDTYGFGNEHIHYNRDFAGNVYEMIDAKGAVYSFGYDLLNRKTSATYPADAYGVNRMETWNFDAAGNVGQYSNRAGATQQLSYDERNRLTSFTWSDGTQGQSFEYDAASRVTALHNAEADIAFGYDAANRKTSETETIKSYGLNQTHTLTYEYDADGNRSRLVYPGGWDYRYAYTNRNQLVSIGLAGLGTPTVQYTYDVGGNRLRRSTYYGGYTDYAYNAISQLSSQASYFGNGYVARYDYGFDAINRIKYEQRNSSVADAFGYDALNQLTGYRHDGTVNQDGTVSGGYEIGISYDPNGNRIAATEACCVAPYSAAPNNQYTSDWTGALSYDSNANLTGRAGWGFAYDAQNRLTAIDSGGTHLRYHYDPLNRIVARETNGDITTQIWDGWNLIEEHASNDGFKRMYLHGAAMNEVVGSYGPAWGDAFYFQDGRGDVTHVTGPSNNIIEHYTYFPAFGQPTIDDGYGNLRSSSILDNRFLFKGALFVPGPDIYDMRNRFYLPNLGRFMQSDPLGFGAGDTNLFRYCGNDPVNNSDPDGLTVRFGPGSDGRAINTAINYLNGSSTFGHIFSILQNSAQTYTINTNYSFMNGSFYYPTTTVTWNPGYGLQVTSGGIQSPALALAHELVHAFHYDSDPANYPNIRQITMPGYEKFVEYVAVTYETLIARELGEKATRTDHGGTFVAVGSPISTNPALSTWLNSRSTGFINFYLRGLLQFGRGWGTGSGLNPGSFGGASADAVAAAGLYLAFLGGGQPGEGTHPVPYDLQ